MKTVRIIAMALVACMALCLTSCNKNVSEPVSGTYGVTADKDVPSGAGSIFAEMSDAVTSAGNFSFRSEANDSAVKAAADKVYNERKGTSDINATISVVFKPGNVSGQAEKKPELVKAYKFEVVE